MLEKWMLVLLIVGVTVLFFMWWLPVDFFLYRRRKKRARDSSLHWSRPQPKRLARSYRATDNVDLSSDDESDVDTIPSPSAMDSKVCLVGKSFDVADRSRHKNVGKKSDISELTLRPPTEVHVGEKVTNDGQYHAKTVSFIDTGDTMPGRNVRGDNPDVVISDSKGQESSQTRQSSTVSLVEEEFERQMEVNQNSGLDSKRSSNDSGILRPCENDAYERLNRYGAKTPPCMRPPRLFPLYGRSQNVIEPADTCLSPTNSSDTFQDIDETLDNTSYRSSKSRHTGSLKHKPKKRRKKKSKTGGKSVPALPELMTYTMHRQ